ncbi:Ankyrin repeats containing protein [Candidatus Babela massiliensis]|uniref:Ankyrin repeats containing protein n=2 Tax=Candidatus Babela massiliensis TaxID=673862 RepID=V6DHG8_9BACT|nr:Ankyrin repeats containing protein [Candidatus Babela massiliensis]
MLLIFNYNLNSMSLFRQNHLSEKLITDLPNEMALLILKQVIDQTIKDYFNSFDNLFDVSIKTCEKNLKEIIEDICHECIYVPKTCQIFRAICKVYSNQIKISIENFRKERFDYLKNNIQVKLEKNNDKVDIEVRKILDQAFNNSRFNEVQLEVLLRKVLYLIANEANINIRSDYGYTALMIFSKFGYRDIVEFLIDVGADVNAITNSIRAPGVIGSNNSLIYAIKERHYDIIKLLIDQGADINAKNDWNITPLIEAVESGNKDIVTLLLDNDADIDINSKRGTALMISAMKGYYDIFKLLIERNANSDYRNNMGDNAMSLAAYYGHLPIVNLLIDKAVDNINDQNPLTGCTALMEAIKVGHVEIVQLFLSKNIELNLRNNNGQTALDIAIRTLNDFKFLKNNSLQYKTIVKLIKEYERKNIS